MGSNNGNEQPLHDVTIESFDIMGFVKLDTNFKKWYIDLVFIGGFICYQVALIVLQKKSKN